MLETLAGGPRSVRVSIVGRGARWGHFRQDIQGRVVMGRYSNCDPIWETVREWVLQHGL